MFVNESLSNAEAVVLASSKNACSSLVSGLPTADLRCNPTPYSGESGDQDVYSVAAYLCSARTAKLNICRTLCRSSHCDAPLVEQLPVSHHDSERERKSGSSFFTRNGTVIILPISIVAMMLLIAALRDNPLAIPIMEVFWGTTFAFLLVFCDMGPGRGGGKGTKGYSLGEEVVRQKLRFFLLIHVGVLVLIFAGVTGAFWLRRHGSPHFDLIVLVVTLAPQFAEAQFFRRLLGRALSSEHGGREV